MIEIIEASRTEALMYCLIDVGDSVAMRNHIDNSEIFLLIFYHGAFIGIFGVRRVSMLSTQGYCWFAETAKLPQCKRAFTRASIRVRDLLLEQFTEIVGIAREGRKWLEWLGAEFAEPDENGWHPFIFRRVHG